MGAVHLLLRSVCVASVCMMNSMRLSALVAVLVGLVSADSFHHGGGHHHGGHGKGSSSGSFSSGPGKNVVHEVPLTVPSPYAVHEPVYVPVVKKYPVEHHVTIIKKIKVPITTIKKVPVEVIKKIPVPVHDHHGHGYH